MRSVLLPLAIKLNNERKRRSIWRRLVRALSVIVVFCTTYALILPAITMEKNLVCGLEAHAHGQSCYTHEEVTQLQCPVQMTGGLPLLHSHSTLCYDEEGTLRCTLAELEAHTHDRSCLEQTCGLEEVILHSHEGPCYETVQLPCPLAADDSHTCDEGCVITEQKLVCTREEVLEHIHGDSCYEIVDIDCPLLEEVDHTCDDTCVTTQRQLVCRQQEIIGHTHSEACYGEPVCGKQELRAHAHSNDCYASGGEDPALEPTLICTLPEAMEHQHSAGCTTTWAEEVITCGRQPHAHTEDCYAKPEDPEATHVPEAPSDRDQWEPVVQGLPLTRQWGQDVLTVAKSQLGYALSAGVQRTPTVSRYNAWYGQTTARWDAVFAAFCLNYAQVSADAVPWSTDSQQWMEQLSQLDLLRTLSQHQPEIGDLVFYETDAGITTGIAYTIETQNDPVTGEPVLALVRVIAGDLEGAVAETSVMPEAILGVCSMTEAQQRHETGAPTLMVWHADIENYIVTVTHSSDLELPAGTELVVTEYPKDSDYFRQRCEEAGYELEWLLNIGFWADGRELDLDGRFSVTVTGKDAQNLGSAVTHFTSDGPQQLTGEQSPDKVDGSRTSVSFSADGFSDYGGGIATLSIGDSFDLLTVDPTTLTPGKEYVIYTGTNNNYAFLTCTDWLNTVNVNGAQYWTSPYTVNGQWHVTADQMGSNDSTYFTWRVEVVNGETYLVSNRHNQRLMFNSGSIWLDGTSLPVTITPTSTGAAGATVTQVHSYGDFHLRENNGWTATNYSWLASTVYFAEVNPDAGGTDDPTPSTGKAAVKTGEVEVKRLRFYNLAENGSGVSPLPGCVFEITGPNGYKKTVVSGGEPSIDLPTDLANGTYTITQVSAPMGYIRDDEHTRTFQVRNGAFVADKNIGIFMNHKIDQLTAGKTAEVEDYNNRIYQVLMDAETHMRKWRMDPIDVLFVVDQSNSMLFPSGLQDTGKSVTLYKDSGWRNTNNMNNTGLSKDQVYYVITEPGTTSTVYAIWYQNGAWLYQDASYYAKAYYNNAPGYQGDGETAIHPSNQSYNDQKTAEKNTNNKSNGGGLGHSLAGSKLANDMGTASSKSFRLYTATDEYNRLHYLQEALTNMIYELADVSTKNRVTITEFTKEVKAEDDVGPLELTPANVTTLVNEVDSINTSGGTRQDIALNHVYTNHLTSNKETHKDAQHTYTILITDGAPVLSGGSALDNLGSPNDAPTTTGNTVYGQIQGWAAKVREESTLMTVGLGMGSAEAGKQVLEKIASPGDYYCALDDAAALTESMHRILFNSFKPEEEIDFRGDLVDEISDSFYPIAWVPSGDGVNSGRTVVSTDAARDWVLLQPGDRITLDGRYTTDSNAAGQLLQKSDGTYYIQWLNQPISQTNGWNGTFYVKAKEDFIGGNAIDTNKHAKLTVNGSDVTFNIPTVNVRLLDMNEMTSEVTVYLGDIINEAGSSPEASLRGFYEETRFTKLVSGGSNVLNKLDPGANAEDGLEQAVFYLKYAMGRDLTEDEWTSLKNGNTITVPYTYDYASSHGPVGEFTFRLTKTGEGADYNEHFADHACQPEGLPSSESCTDPVETYTLHVTYTAYRLNEDGRPQYNSENGSGSPGTEVGTGSTLATGSGSVIKHNVHEVHVISGVIEITKRLAEGQTVPQDWTFSFTLHRQEDGDSTANDVTKTITIPAGSSEGAATIRFEDLPRGTYVVTEAPDEEYRVKDITVRDTTNCYSSPAPGASGDTVTFVMGNNRNNLNVIGKAPDARYTSYTDPVNGVYGAAGFVNEEIVYYGEVPVAKVWDDGSGHHGEDAVYLVLLKDGSPVLDGDNRARILRLDGANSWSGSFRVILADKTDTVSNYDWSVREATEVTNTETYGWHPAVLENDGATVMWYEAMAAEGDVVSINSKGYVVRYTETADQAQTVTNYATVALPSTGGPGTHLFTRSGLLILAAAGVYSCILRHKRQKGGG